MGQLLAIDGQTFGTVVLQSSVPVLVDFWAEWCAPCRKLHPTLEALAEELGDKLKIVKVDVQAVQDLPAQFGVMNIPTLILFKDGQEVKRIIGNRSKKRLLKDLQPYL
jgi:thioredoxin 1